MIWHHLAGFVVGKSWPPPWGNNPPHWVPLHQWPALTHWEEAFSHLWSWTLAGWR